MGVGVGSGGGVLLLLHRAVLTLEALGLGDVRLMEDPSIVHFAHSFLNVGVKKHFYKSVCILYGVLGILQQVDGRVGFVTFQDGFLMEIGHARLHSVGSTDGFFKSRHLLQPDTKSG